MSNTREVIEQVFAALAPSVGKLSLFLAAKRGLSKRGLMELAENLETAAKMLRSLLQPARPE